MLNVVSTHTNSDFAFTCSFVPLLYVQIFTIFAWIGSLFKCIVGVTDVPSGGYGKCFHNFQSLKLLPINFENLSYSDFFPVKRLPSFNPLITYMYSFLTSNLESSMVTSYGFRTKVDMITTSLMALEISRSMATVYIQLGGSVGQIILFSDGQMSCCCGLKSWFV